MPVYQNKQAKTWYAKVFYTDYTGKKHQKMKRGFKLRREALEWEREFMSTQASQPDMSFSALCELYLRDKETHNKQITYETKKNRVKTWLIPTFGKRPINSITATDVRQWQAALKEATGSTGKPLSPGYMQNLVTELSSVMNFAVRFYGLSVNPCKIAGNTVGKKQRSLNFWTKQEFDRFISTFEPSDPYCTAFMTLYYCGMRIGELEALTLADLDTQQGTISINKTYHLINGSGITTPPKTKKANRIITLPPFLIACLESHISRLYHPDAETRLFTLSHSSYARALEAHADMAGVPRIRLHDIRHSHASLLIELGFSALLVSERLGHESVSTTLNIYSHLFPSKQAEVAERLERLQCNS